MRSRVVRVALALSLVVWIGGCGFQLQGREPWPAELHRVRIDAVDSQSDFVAALQAMLRTGGAELIGDKQSDAPVIRITLDELTQKVLAVSSANLPREYELTYRVKVRVDAGERSLMPEQTLELSRDFTFDEREVLAKEHEREQLRADLARELAANVLQRLRAR